MKHRRLNSYTKRLSSYTKIFAVIALLAGLSFFASGRLINFKSGKAKSEVVKNKATESEPIDTTIKITKYDPRVLGRFIKICSKLNAYSDEFFISGTLTYIDMNDSTENAKPLTYVLNKKGQSMYYRLGDTEAINNEGVYMYVDHALKKIMISKKKRVTATPFIPETRKLIKSLQDEGYRLVADTLGTLNRITVVNENHISCKMYRIAYDPASLDPKQIYLKLSDPQMPEDGNKGKIIQIDITECGPFSKEQQFNVEKFIKPDNSSQNRANEQAQGKTSEKEARRRAIEQRTWSKATAYEGYELIVM